MTRVEEKGLEAYPQVWNEEEDYDVNLEGRIGFIDGYKSAEKDLALTIKDMERIHTFLYAIKNNKQGQFTFTRLTDEQYEEAIRRFNEYREKK